MAKRKVKRSAIGAILLAVVVGVAVGAAVYPRFEGPPPLTLEELEPKIEFEWSYDDSIGRLGTPDRQWQVTHVLISWHGSGASPRESGRTQDEAWELVQQLWHRYRKNPTSEHWRELQEKYSDDQADVYKVYHSGDRLVEPFKECASTTRVGHARIVESQFGYHLIRREK
jgi:hypothetical protein